MSIRNSRLEEVEGLVVQNEGVNPCLVSFDWYVVDVGLNMGPFGDLIPVIVDNMRRIHEALLAKAVTRKTSRS